MKTFIRALISLATQASMLWVAWSAGHDNAACRNVVLFLAGLHWFCVLGLALAKYRITAKPTPLPQWLMNASNAAYITLLVIPGFFWCAAAAALCWAFMAHNKTLPADPKKAAEPA